MSTCPQCAARGIETELEPYAEVDIGVGVMHGGPWGCPVCRYVADLEKQARDAGFWPDKETPDDWG